MEQILDQAIAHFFIFLGYSVIWVPLITGISWGVFCLLQGKTKLSRADLVGFSCIAVTVGFIALGMYGRQRGMVFEASVIYQGIDGAFAIVIGLLFWGKPKKTAIKVDKS